MMSDPIDLYTLNGFTDHDFILSVVTINFITLTDSVTAPLVVVFLLFFIQKFVHICSFNVFKRMHSLQMHAINKIIFLMN